MKKRVSLLLILTLLCALLAGCGAGETGDPCLAEGPDGSKDVSLVSDGSSDHSDACTAMRCRVVAANGNDLLVASVDSEYPDIYDLSTDGVALLMRQGDGAAVSADEANLTAPSAGAMVEVCFSGGILETYPARFGGVTHVTVLPDEFDDRCALYLAILEELWGEDAGLNSAGVDCVSVDLSETSLTPAERSAVAWTFAQSHGAEILERSYAELVKDGYITGTEQGGFPQWENGVLFTLAEDEDAIFNLPMTAKSAVSLDASKWRSALGAYGFTVTAVQDSSGAWGKPSIGAAWIS